MPLKELPSFLERNFTELQLKELYHLILEQRHLGKQYFEPEEKLKLADEETPDRSKKISFYYLFLIVYFGIFFIYLYLHIYRNFQYPTPLFIICSSIVFGSMIILIHVIPYIYRKNPFQLKISLICKLIFYLYLFLLLSAISLIFIPAGFNEGFTILMWGFSLFLVVSSASEVYYLWTHLLKGKNSLFYIKVFHFFLIFMHFPHMVLSFFLLGYFGPIYSDIEITIIVMIFLCGFALPALSWAENLERYKEVKQSNKFLLINSIRQSSLLSFRYRIFLIVLIGDSLLALSVFFFFFLLSG